MDATRLALPDGAFDVVVAQYVITAVPHPEETLDEFARVLKPGGEIVLVNHIGAETGLRRAFENAFAPLARRLGWRPEFPWARLAAWADAPPRHPPDRAPPDAAARPFLADPLRQAHDGCDRAGTRRGSRGTGGVRALRSQAALLVSRHRFAPFAWGCFSVFLCGEGDPLSAFALPFHCMGLFLGFFSDRPFRLSPPPIAWGCSSVF